MDITIIKRAAPALLLLQACQVDYDRSLVRQRAALLFAGQEQTSAGTHDLSAAMLPSRSDLLAQADLADYLSYGLYHNAGLHQAFEHWQAALQRIPQVSSLPDPVFSFAQFVEEVQTRTGPQDRRYGITQAFPWFGTLEHRGAAATSAAAEEWQKVEEKRLQVRRDISVAYFEYGYLAQSIRITSQILQLLQRLDPVVQRKVQAGAGLQDLLRLQVEIGKVENDLASLTHIQPTLSARLAAAMNLPGREVLPLPNLTEPESVTLDSATLLEQADARNPAVLEISERIEKNKQLLEVAKLQKWPNLSIGADYVETGSALFPNTRGSGDDPIALRFSMSLPIWRSRYAAAEREAARNIAASQFQLQDIRSNLHADVELAAFQLGDAARQVSLYRDSLLPRAREALNVTRAAYRTGTAPLLDLIDSERALLDFETAYWRACRDQFQGEARLETLIGGSIR